MSIMDMNVKIDSAVEARDAEELLSLARRGDEASQPPAAAASRAVQRACLAFSASFTKGDRRPFALIASILAHHALKLGATSRLHSDFVQCVKPLLDAREADEDIAISELAIFFGRCATCVDYENYGHLFYEPIDRDRVRVVELILRSAPPWFSKRMCHSKWQHASERMKSILPPCAE